MNLVKVFVYHSIVNLTVIIDENNGGCVLKVILGLAIDPDILQLKESNDLLLKANIEKAFKEFFEGKPNAFSKITIDMSGKTQFQKDVLKAARRIPRGNVVSYSDLAVMAGYPRAIRAVASVMRNNNTPLIVPCHRVITKSGKLGGFMGKVSGTAIDLKARLLKNEGVHGNLKQVK